MNPNSEDLIDERPPRDCEAAKDNIGMDVNV